MTDDAKCQAALSANEGLADQLDTAYRDAEIADEAIRDLEYQVVAAVEENDELRRQLKEANRNYGRASETIGLQRHEIRSLRLEKQTVVRLYNQLVEAF